MTYELLHSDKNLNIGENNLCNDCQHCLGTTIKYFYNHWLLHVYRSCRVHCVLHLFCDACKECSEYDPRYYLDDFQKDYPIIEKELDNIKNDFLGRVANERTRNEFQATLDSLYAPGVFLVLWEGGNEMTLYLVNRRRLMRVLKTRELSHNNKIKGGII